LVEFEAINRRYLAASETFERMMEGYDMLKGREEWENARERADAITHYGEINDDWQDALDVSDELVREIMAEPVASPADLAIKLSAPLPTLDRHEFLDDDMTEQLGLDGPHRGPARHRRLQARGRSSLRACGGLSEELEGSPSRVADRRHHTPPRLTCPGLTAGVFFRGRSMCESSVPSLSAGVA
jgi:hypothetical protein